MDNIIIQKQEKKNKLTYDRVWIYIAYVLLKNELPTFYQMNCLLFIKKCPPSPDIKSVLLCNIAVHCFLEYHVFEMNFKDECNLARMCL